MDKVQATMLRAYMHRGAWIDYRDSLKPELLTDNTAVALLSHMNALHESSDRFEVTKDQIAAHIDATFGDMAASANRREELIGALEEVVAVDLTDTDEGVLHEIFRRFIGREWARRAARTLITTITSGELDFHSAEEQLCYAVDAMEGRRDTVLDYSASGLPDRDVDRPGIVPLGLSARLDRALHGGAANGELVIFFGGTGSGKTSALTAVAANLLAQGKHVLYVTLEINEMKTARRVDSALTGLTYEGLLNTPGVVESTKRRVLANGGSLYIKNWAYVQTSASAVRGLVKSLRRRGKQVDVVLIDYIGLMVPDTFMMRREVRHSLGCVVEDVRRVAAELQVPVISAWQSNREGYGQDTLRLSHFSESWEPVKTADIIIGINAGSAERTDSRLRLAILKQREESARPEFYLRVDMDRNTWMDDFATQPNNTTVTEVSQCADASQS